MLGYTIEINNTISLFIPASSKKNWKNTKENIITKSRDIRSII